MMQRFWRKTNEKQFVRSAQFNRNANECFYRSRVANRLFPIVEHLSFGEMLSIIIIYSISCLLNVQKSMIY